MSVGNLKSDGNKGNNFPWQLKMLIGQQCACDNLVDINTNTVNVDSLLNQILNIPWHNLLIFKSFLNVHTLYQNEQSIR